MHHTGNWGGAILRAVGTGRGGSAASAVLASASGVPGRGSQLRIPRLVSKVEEHAVDVKSSSAYLATANDEVYAGLILHSYMLLDEQT